MRQRPPCGRRTAGGVGNRCAILANTYNGRGIRRSVCLRRNSLARRAKRETNEKLKKEGKDVFEK